MTYLITPPGTHGIVDGGRWWRPGSLWWQAAERKGFKHPCPEDPFFWDTDLEGTLGENYGWMAAGAALRWYMATYYFKDGPTSIVAFSHGGNVAVHALSDWMSIKGNLVTVGTPVRPEMQDVYEVAAQSCNEWHHIHSDEADIWQAAGSLGGPEWWQEPFTRKMPYANNIEAPGLSHHMLVDPNIWDAKGLWELLR